MRILVLGGDGMLGHQLLSTLGQKHQVKATLRQDADAYKKYNYFNNGNSFFCINVLNFEDVLEVLINFKPEVVINAVGIVKQRKAAKEIIPSLEINSLLPHRLFQLCKLINARLVHISTDCIFAGVKGDYFDDDKSDAEDIYGKTKYLGEVNEVGAITLRTSIIGLELSRKNSLIEWFLAQKGKIKGFTQAIYSGLTTIELSRVIEFLLIGYPNLYGVWHVSSDPINKYELLTKFSNYLQRTDIAIEPAKEFYCERSLNSQRFREATGYTPPTWDFMLEELAVQTKMRENLI